MAMEAVVHRNDQFSTPERYTLVTCSDGSYDGGTDLVCHVQLHRQQQQPVTRCRIQLQVAPVPQLGGPLVVHWR